MRYITESGTPEPALHALVPVQELKVELAKWLAEANALRDFANMVQHAESIAKLQAFLDPAEEPVYEAVWPSESAVLAGASAPQHRWMSLDGVIATTFDTRPMVAALADFHRKWHKTGGFIAESSLALNSEVISLLYSAEIAEALGGSSLGGCKNIAQLLLKS